MLNIFLTIFYASEILLELGSCPQVLTSRVLGSKFGMGYLKFLTKDRKKLLKDILQTEDSIEADTIIVKMKKVILLSFIFILFLKFTPIFSLYLSRIVFIYCKIYILI